MNVKRIILAAMAMVTVASFVDPVAAQTTLQASVGFLDTIVSGINWIADNSDTIITAVETVAEVGHIIGIW